MEELTENLEIADTYSPLDDAEKLAFYRRVLPLVRPQNMPWKANDWDNPEGWLIR